MYEGEKKAQGRIDLITNFLFRGSLQHDSKSSWRLEVHSNRWLSHLKVGKAAEILQEAERASVNITSKY